MPFPVNEDNCIFEYWKKIETGEIHAGKYIRRLYEILTDGIRDGTYVFSKAHADKAIYFIENFCHHSEGRSDLLKLELWQKAAVSAIFGIMDPEDTTRRMFREVVLIVARKNGKTLFSAAIIAYMAYVDGEYGAKIFCCAPKLDQADLAYDDFWQIVQASDDLMEVTKKRRADIYIPEFNTSIKKLAFNSRKSDGFNPQFALCDEIEAWPAVQGSKQYEALSSGRGARKQPLLMSTGTAGYENDGPYDELIRRGTAFLKGQQRGKQRERRLLPFLYIVDDPEKWDQREELEKSNPNMDVSVSWNDFYVDEIATAKNSYPKKVEFLAKYCNIKQNNSAAWLEARDVEKALPKNEDGSVVHLSLEDFRGCACVGGVDLSRTTDLTAASIVIEVEGVQYVFCKFFMPEARYLIAADEESVPYPEYVSKGDLIISGDNFVDYKDVYNWFCSLIKVYKIRPLEIGYDRYSSQYLVQDLKTAGFHTDDVYQGTNLTPIMHEFEGSLKDGKIIIGDNYLLQAHFLNVAAEIDLKDSRMKPIKIDKRSHIDGTMSVLDALTVKSKYHDEVGQQLKNEQFCMIDGKATRKAKK